METLIIQVDCRRYTRDGPPQLGITVEAPFSQRNTLHQKKQQHQQQYQDYQNHDYQNLDSEFFGPSIARSNNLNSNNRQNKNNPLVKQPNNSNVYNKAQQVHEGLQITQIQRDSVIDRTGQFRVGDIIVEVNGVNLQRPFPEAQKTLKQFVVDHTSHGPLILKVLRKSASSSSIPSTTGSQVSVIERDIGSTRQRPIPKITGKTPISKQTQPSIVPPMSQSPISSKSNSSRTSRHLVGAINTRRIGVRHTIKLRKAANGFGIKIAERDNMHSRNRPIYITAITTTGSAYQDGRLREGDMLLQVNGIDIQAKTQSEVTRMLKSIKANEEVVFVVSRQEDLPLDESQEIRDDSASSTNRMSFENNCDKSLIDLDVPDQDDSVFVESISDVQFERKIDSILNVPIIDGPGSYIYDIPLNDTKSAGLGLYLKYPCRADERRDLGIWIEKVITGGAAWKDGRLQPDDQILAINGIDLVGLSNAEASETLTAAVCRGIGPEATVNTIRLRIHRRSPSVVAKILQGTNNRIECSDIIPNAKSFVNDKNTENSRESYQTAFDSTLQDKASEARNSSGSSNQNSQNDSAMSPQTQASNSLKLTNSCNDRSSSDKTNETTSSAISQVTDSTSNVPNSEFLSSERSTNQKYILNDHSMTKKSGNQSSDSLKVTKPKSIRTGLDSAEVQNLDHESSSQSWDDESVDAANCEDHFQRDGFGRQSISEKRHAQLSAKNTDTFRKNQRLREEREQQRLLEEQMSRQHLSDDASTNLYPMSKNTRLPTSYTTNEFKSIYGLQMNAEKTIQHERLVDDYHREMPVDVLIPPEQKIIDESHRDLRSMYSGQNVRIPNGIPSEVPSTMYQQLVVDQRNHIISANQCATCGSDLYSCMCRPMNDQIRMENHFLSMDQSNSQMFKRSNSLESVQQNNVRMDLIIPRAGTVRVARNRKVNESFRAAVDRSYEANMNGSSNRQEMSNLMDHHQNQIRMTKGTAQVPNPIANSITSTSNEEHHLITTKNNPHKKPNSNNNHVNNTTHKKSSSLLTKFLKLGSIKRKKRSKSGQNEIRTVEAESTSNGTSQYSTDGSDPKTVQHSQNLNSMKPKSAINLHQYNNEASENLKSHVGISSSSSSAGGIKSGTSGLHLGAMPSMNQPQYVMASPYQPTIVPHSYQSQDVHYNNHVAAPTAARDQNFPSVYSHDRWMPTNGYQQQIPANTTQQFGFSHHAQHPSMNSYPLLQSHNLDSSDYNNPQSAQPHLQYFPAHRAGSQVNSNKYYSAYQQQMSNNGPQQFGVVQQAPIGNIQYHNNQLRVAPYRPNATHQYPIPSQPPQQIYYYDF